MLKLVDALFSCMNARGIKYCHWKSNNNLDKALNGETDIDLLVDLKDKDSFEDIIRSINFRLAIESKWNFIPFISHYYGLDEETGILVHLHIYFRIITGGSILKNYALQAEEFLLENSYFEGIVKVPSKEADLILLIIRKYIEHTSILEYLLLSKDFKNVKKELCWLLDGVKNENIAKLLKKWFPLMDYDTFFDAVKALKSRRSLLYRIRLGFKIRRQFLGCLMLSKTKASIIRSMLFLYMIVISKLFHKRKDRKMIRNGFVLAFVGPEASGKSTLVREISNWLGEHFRVVSAHAGKPPHTILTFLIWLGIRGYVRLKKISCLSRKGKVEHDNKTGMDTNKYKPHPVISLIDAYERLSLTRKLLRLSRQGVIAVTDRYPTIQQGSIDAPQISPVNKILSILSKVEKGLYQKIPPPDLIIKVVAPLELTMKRNKERNVPEPEDYLKYRYNKAISLSFTNTQFYTVENIGCFNDTLLYVKKIIWRHLGS